MTDATKAINEPKQNTRFNQPSYAGELMPNGAVRGPGGRGDERGGIFDWLPGRETPPCLADHARSHGSSGMIGKKAVCSLP